MLQKGGTGKFFCTKFSHDRYMTTCAMKCAMNQICDGFHFQQGICSIGTLEATASGKFISYSRPGFPKTRISTTSTTKASTTSTKENRYTHTNTTITSSTSTYTETTTTTSMPLTTMTNTTKTSTTTMHGEFWGGKYQKILYLKSTLFIK